jgi:peptidoglycan/xylan/chitin deacetylase (PgdA/CDA1 family)
MEPEKGRARRPAKVWLHARWVSIIPALILIFFVASAAISPRTTQAVDEPSDPITLATTIPTDAATPSTPTIAPTNTDQPTSVPAAFASGLNAPVDVAQPTVQPTATLASVPTATVAPSATAVPPTAIPPTATPSGPTATPNQGVAGNAQPVDGVIRVPVLMYHYIRINPVASDRLGYNLSVTPADFAAQMQWLVTNGFHTIFPSELNAALTQGTPLPTKPIVLTFDDGYRDFYDQAWPVLKQYGLKASSAVITTFIDKGDRGDTMYMNWNMVKELDRSGMVEIASHTLSHPDLSRTAPAQRWQELSQSKQIIEQQIGHPCTAFVYPSGKYDGATVSDASRAGYQIAFTTNDGKVRVPQDSGAMLVLPRVRIAGGTTIPVFAKSVG